MTDHAYRERVTLLLVADALEANERSNEEATIQLLDAAGTLIVHAVRDGTAMVIAQRAADYLIEQVARHQKGTDHG